MNFMKLTNLSKTFVGDTKVLNYTQKKSISYSNNYLKKTIDEGRKISPTMNNTFGAIEKHENNLKLKIDSISRDHDIHKIKGYKESFLASKELKIKENMAMPPHYDPQSNTISLMNIKQHDQTTHEGTHAKDNLYKHIDFSNPMEKLASEFNAFRHQDQTSREITKKSPDNFEGRTPKQMAKSYEGKLGYPGTLEESMKVVEKRIKNSSSIYDKNSSFAENLSGAFNKRN